VRGVAALWRRSEFGWVLHYVGLFATVAAGFFAVVGLPIPVVDPPLGAGVPELSLDFVPLSVRPVRFAALVGLALHSVGTFLDQHHSGEVLDQGEGSRGEQFVASSLFSVGVAAVLTLLIVLLYRGLEQP
jgi:hypothetical protein